MSQPTTKKRSFRESRWYRPLLLVTTIVALIPTVVAVLAFPVSNHLVHRDWVDFRSRWEAEGEIFDLDVLLPRPIPDDQNFARSALIVDAIRTVEAPRLSRSHDGDTHHHESDHDHGAAPAPQSSRLASLAIFDRPSQATQPEPKPPLAYLVGTPVDLARFLPGNHPEKTKTEARRYFQEWFARHEPVIAELQEAAALPGAYYPIDRQKPSATRLSHLPDLIGALHGLHLYNLVLVDTDQSEAATRQLVSTLRLIRQGTESPGLASFSIRTAALEQGPLEAIWQALFRQELDSKQWKAVDAELEPYTFGPHLLDTLRFERAALIREIENQFAVNRTRPFAIPPAWIPVSGLLTYGELTQRYWFTDGASGRPLTAGPHLGQLAIIEAHVAAQEVSLENFVLATGVLPVADMAIQSDRVQIQRDHARLAIALERFRLQHGELPERLSELVPEWLPEIPLHPQTGLPPRYERPDLSIRDSRPGEYRLRALGDSSDGRDPVWVMPHRSR